MESFEPPEGVEAVSIYADNDEKFLNLGPEYPGLWDAILGPEIAPLSPDSFVSFYWGQQASWNGILHTLTKNAHEHWQSAYGPETLPTHEGTGSPVGGPPAAERGTIQYAVSITRFLYSPCFITDPLAWEGDFRFNRTTDLMPFFKTTRMSQIRSPAGKGLLINKQIPGANDQAHVVFVDGSTESRAIANFVPPTYYPTASLPTTPGVPVLHTKQGVNGRDR